MPIDTDIYLDKNDRKIVSKTTQDTTPILEQNKIFRNHVPEAQKGDFQRIAQIPLIALQLMTKKRHGHSNYSKLSLNEQKELIKNMIASNEFEYFRTGDKKRL